MWVGLPLGDVLSFLSKQVGLLVGGKEARRAKVLTYPNPAMNVLVVEKENIPLTNSATFEIMDVNGAVVLKQNVNSDTQQVLDISSFAAGNYYILLKDQEELVCKQSFIKL